MKGFNNILITLAVALVVAGCNNEPQGIGYTDYPIILSATEQGMSRALLDEETFSATDNKIKIYDYYTPVAGAAEYYIGVDPDEYIKSAGPGLVAWPFVEKKYSWTPNGVHKFFGWMAEDVNMTSSADAAANTPAEFFGSGFGFNTTSQVLTIPSRKMIQGVPQFDFMYSDIYERNLTTTPDFATYVPLEFSHLFTAFNVTAENRSANTIKLKSVTISGIKDSKSATVTYSGTKGTTGSTAAVIAYSEGTTSVDSFIFAVADGGNLTDQPMQVADYNLTWPQTDADLAAAVVKVVYDYSDGRNTSTNVYKEVPLSSIAGWEAGKRNNLNLVFKDKEIVLECVVEPWELVDEVIDFSDQVSVTTKLTPDEETVRSWNPDTGEVIFYDNVDMQAVFNFRIETPKGATWTAALIPVEGHQDAFEFVKDTKYGAVGVDSELRIRVTNNAPIAPRHVCKLRITVQTADGRTIVVKNLMPLNSNGTTMVDNDGNVITEYTIIQNLING